MKKFLAVLMVFTLISITPIQATPGRLKGNSITTCNGVTYGQHSSDNHWHVASLNSNGTYNASGNPIYSNPCGSPGTPSNGNNGAGRTAPREATPDPEHEEPVIVKSSDTSIKEIKVNGDSVEVSSEMTYETKEEIANIEVSLNDENASVEYSKTIELLVGDNTADFIVTAEDESVELYSLLINREEIVLSSIKGFTLKINDVVVNFVDHKASIEVKDRTFASSISLNHEKATTDFEGDISLKANDPYTLKFSVTAEDGSSDEYELEITYSVESDPLYVAIFFGLIIIVVGVFVYTYQKKQRERRIQLQREIEVFSNIESNDNYGQKKKKWFGLF